MKIKHGIARALELQRTSALAKKNLLFKGFVHGLWSVVYCPLLVFFFFVSLFTFHSSLSFANNLSISNVSLEDRNQNNDTAVVEFDITWDNAWNISTAPANHDAIWVFLKVCKGGSCSPSANTAWTHGMLATAGTDPSDTDPGSEGNLTIEVPADKIGAFIYSSQEGSQDTITSTNVRLTLDYAASPLSAGDTDDIQVKVFGIEMVYIPQGNFYIGDGNATNESSYAFHTGSADNTSQQVTTSLLSDVQVDVNANDDDWIETTGIGIDGDDGLDVDNDGTVDNYSFPTGYEAFYLMKYELTQAQYRDFLNTLTQEQQDKRVAATLSDEAAANEYVMASDGATTPTVRDTIKAGSNPSDGLPYSFTCDLDDDDTGDEPSDGEWIAMNYVNWMDLAAYADWAGLRPMTELEFEKATRGPTAAVYGEYAWGTTDLTQAEGAIQNSGTTSEVANTTGSGLASYDGSGTDISGPLRVGFAATSSTGRLSAGAGYYGSMELSGNIWDRAVTVGNSTGRGFEGTHGDGVLTTTSSYEGNATNVDWPGIDGTAARGVTGDDGCGFRGGAYNQASARLSISNRYNASLSYTTRLDSIGGRLARSDSPVTYDTVLYITTATHDGDFDSGSGPRAGLDSFCTSNKPSNLSSSCVNQHAFISVSSSDEIVDMPSNYYYRADLPVYWWNNTNQTYTELATDWDDMLDGSIDVSQVTGAGDGSTVWTGSDEYGAVDTAHNCLGFTSNSSSDDSWEGDGGSASSYWLGAYVLLDCSDVYNIRCLCQIPK